MNRVEQQAYEIYIPPKWRKIVKNTYAETYKLQECMREPRSNEQIECRLCGGLIDVYRHQPRTGKVNPLYLSTSFSTYKPQGLQQCECGEMQVLVDHHGRVRIYSLDDSKVSVRFPVVGLCKAYAAQNLSLAKHVDNWVAVDKNLTVNARSRKLDRRFDKVNHLNLWPIRERFQQNFLPYPVDRHQFYLDYAHTYQITLLVTIKGKRTMYFQNGFHKADIDHEYFKELIYETCSYERANELVEEAKEMYVTPLVNAMHGLRKAPKSKMYPQVIVPFLPWVKKLSYKVDELTGYRRVTQNVYGKLKKLQQLRTEILNQPSYEGKYLIWLSNCYTTLKRPEHSALMYYLDRYPEKRKHYTHLHPSNRAQRPDYIPL